LIKYIDYVPVEPDLKMIMARLGYRSSSTILSPVDKEKLSKGIKEGLLLCEPKGVYRILNVTQRDKDKVVLEDDVVLVSEKLSMLLKDSVKVIMMSATVGKEVVDRAALEVKSGDGALGVILDAVASEAADSVLDWIMKFMDNTLIREGQKLTSHRFSAGYGDFLLHHQKIFYDTLDLGKLGISITESFMLVPEKSVTAIAGIERR